MTLDWTPASDVARAEITGTIGETGASSTFVPATTTGTVEGTIPPTVGAGDELCLQWPSSGGTVQWELSPGPLARCTVQASAYRCIPVRVESR